MEHEFEGVRFTCNIDIDEHEAEAYILRGIRNFNYLHWVEAEADGDEIELRYHCDKRKFERIRRVTGYLVGTLDRWNDGKRAEEKDRVKHGV